MTRRGPEIGDIFATMYPGPAPEPAGEARAWLDAHRGGLGAFVDGAFSPPGEDATSVSDPATGTVLAAVARASAASVEAAVAAAGRAAAAWAGTPDDVRACHLRAVARALERRGRTLAVLDALNTGRPVRTARDRDLPRAVRCFSNHAGSAELGATDHPGRPPLGVVALILPRHATLAALARGVAPALAAGNAVVVQPAEATPLVALAFAELCRDAGLPPGLVDAVPGDGAPGAALARHPGVAGIAFAGPRAQARAIAAAAAGSGKALDLAPDGAPQRVLVFADADLDAAVEGVVEAAWSGGGPSGLAGARILVQEGVAARFAAKLRRRLETLRVGDPLDRATDVGATADADRLGRLAAAAEADGAELVRAAAPLPSGLTSGGSFFPPTLLLGVEPASALAGTDFSGPLATLSTFRTPAEGIALAGDDASDAAVWSQDVDLALDAALRVRAGTVWVNSAGAEPGDAADVGAESLERQLGPAPSARLPARRSAAPSTPTALAAGGDVGPAVAAAVGAAVGAGAWGTAPARERARVLAAAAEDLAARAPNLVDLLSAAAGGAVAERGMAEREVEAALRRTSFYAACAGRLDRLGGRSGTAGARRLLLRVDEPRGVLGVVCPDEAPLLALASLALPALAAGDRVVAVPSALCPAAAAFARALAAAGLPPGALSIAAGERGASTRSLALALAAHDGVDAVWHHGPAAEAAAVERAAAGRLRPVWADDGPSRDWHDDATAQGEEFLRRALRVRTVWLPYGE